MKYNIPNGYALVTDTAREISKKHNLSNSLEKKLYRRLLEQAKISGKKYSQSENCRIWLLDITDLNEEKLLSEIQGNLEGQISFEPFLEETNNELLIQSFNDIDKIELISKLRKDRKSVV